MRSEKGEIRIIRRKGEIRRKGGGRRVNGVGQRKDNLEENKVKE